MGAIGDIASTIGRGISNLMHMGGRKVKQVPDLIDLRTVTYDIKMAKYSIFPNILKTT